MSYNDDRPRGMSFRPHHSRGGARGSRKHLDRGCVASLEELYMPDIGHRKDDGQKDIPQNCQPQDMVTPEDVTTLQRRFCPVYALCESDETAIHKRDCDGMREWMVGDHLLPEESARDLAEDLRAGRGAVDPSTYFGALCVTRRAA